MGMQNSEFRMFAEPHNPKSKIQNPKLSSPVPQNYLDRPLGTAFYKFGSLIVLCWALADL